MTLDEHYENEARRVFKSWRKHQFNWGKTFPDLPQEKGSRLDLISNLMKVDIGILFRSIQRQNSQQEKFGLIPRIASCFLGRCMAESFSERTYRCAKDVLTEGNSLLSDEEINMVLVPRMNRPFVEYMRKAYSSVRKQNFNITLRFEEKKKN